MLERVPSARVETTAVLSSHVLRFHKASKDGSAKCDVVETRQAADVVHGVVFEMAEEEKSNLDLVEGLGHGYDEKDVRVVGSDGEAIDAFTYYATDIDEGRKPYPWYKAHVVRGATENRLPSDYVARIKEVESTPDPDPSRHDREMSIYR